MAQFNTPSFTPEKKKNPDDEYIRVFDKLRNLITNPEKGPKAKEALIGLVLRHSDIADQLSDVVSDPDLMEEVMAKYPHLTGYAGKNLAERAREVTNPKQQILDRINKLENTFGAPTPSMPPVAPQAPPMPSVPPQTPQMPPMPPQEPQMPPMPPQGSMGPASTPSRTAPFPVNPATGQLIK